MSSNNIVVIIKGEDGKFRGYHRDYDAYCEGQYEKGPWPITGGIGCGHCMPLEETPIFEADTIEGAIHAYDRWVEEMNDNEEGISFYCEYGYQFENLAPCAETVETLEKLERGEDVHTVDSVEELMKELESDDDEENLLYKVDGTESGRSKVEELNMSNDSKQNAEPAETDFLDEFRDALFAQLIADHKRWGGYLVKENKEWSRRAY